MVDAVVAGGGPAGSACALLLARAGLAVTLVERATFPRRKVCGEYLNSGAVAALDRLGVLGEVRAQAFALRGVRLVPPRAPSVELPFSHGALACERETLDAILLRAAVYAGVTVVHGRVEDVLRDRGRIDGLWVRNDDGTVYEVRARWTVGADGCGSVVARRAGLTRHTWRGPKFAVGGHYAGFGDLGGFVEMYVGAGAYFALNPLGHDKTNVMVVIPKSSLATWSGFVDEGVAGKAAELGRGHRSFAGAQRIGTRAAIGPLAHSVRAPVANGVVLIGDAAGFLNPFTGQGVFLALTSAEGAARAILAGAADTSRERGAFATYAEDRRVDFAARKRLSAAVGWLIDVPPLARRAAAKLAPQLGDHDGRRIGRNAPPAERAHRERARKARLLITTENRIDIAATPETIYHLASATERWPELLPHYRYVRVLAEDGPVRTVQMAARHGIVPLRWTAEQTNDPQRPHIAFHHVAGPTRGMDVEWIFTPLDADHTRVQIVHRLAFIFPLAAEFFGKYVVSDVFIHGVATKTLARMKVLAEGGAR